MRSLRIARNQFRNILWLLAFFSLAVNLLMLVLPLYMLQIYDRILPSQSMDTLVFLSVIAFAALAVLGALEAVRAILASRSAARMEAILGGDALRISLLNSRQGEADVQPVRDLQTIRNFVSSRMVFALLDMPFAPLFILLLYVIHPVLFWLTLAGAAALLAVAIFNQRYTDQLSRQAGGEQNAALNTAQALARNAHTLRAMGMTGNAIEVWGKHNAGALVAQGEIDTRNAMLSGLSRTIRMGLQVAILGVGGLLVLRGEMTPGMIFAASIISGRGLQPIDQVIGGWKQFAVTWRSWVTLQSALERAGDEPARTRLNAPRGEISVDGAAVISPGGISAPPILNRISFSVAPGEVLGVVGPSGSGKSTTARLLVGAQKPHAGVIRIDGTDLDHWDPAQLGQHIGYLGQEVELLPGTVAQNIARLASKPDSAAVLEAAQKAQVHELIQNLPNGYDTLIGPGGLGLSGGQRQRVALARAFYGNPQIMVLDEPNANLDDDGELALQRAIQTAREAGVTMIIITQRKQVLNAVDKILRMHQGNVDFFGTRENFVAALQAKRRMMQEESARRARHQAASRQAQAADLNQTANQSAQADHPAVSAPRTLQAGEASGMGTYNMGQG